MGSEGSSNTQPQSLGRLGPWSGLRREIRGYIKIKVSSYLLFGDKFVVRNGLKISPAKLWKQDFLHYFSVIKPET